MEEKIDTKGTLKVAIATILLILVFLLGFFYGRFVVQSLEEDKEEQERFEMELTEVRDNLDDWMTLQMAIVMTESKFNPKAVGKDADWGVFQQTPIYVKECNRILSIRKEEEKYVHEDSFDIGKSIEMFNLLQSHYNPDKDLALAIRYQNRAGWYKKRVEENIQFIQRMEEVRKEILERN